ncbi:MAG TPA: glycoside hydrolase domain-containing protein [Mycobacteriales bacterium]|nr:glycoside hydrolase domain-containing protein [Mycobacteriales bacterium]
MRSPARAAAALAAAALTALGITASARASDTLPTTRDISYAGATISVPASWPVYDLTTDPHRCVRFDQHAVYLGHPGPDQNCPSHLVGRTSAVLIEPYDETARTHVETGSDGTVQHLSANGQAMITATYGGDGPAAATAALKGTDLSTAAPQASESVTADAAPPDTATPARKTFTGKGFDTCAAPSLASMRAWGQSSPYGAVGIYVGGISRGCGLGNLDHGWVQSVRGYGFHFIPTYVGRQAPCTGFSSKISTDSAVAHSQGTWAAQDAIRAMRALGFGAGSPVYIDIEQYDGDAACSNAVVQFVAGWSGQLHKDGFLSGFYSSQLSDIIAKRHIAHPDAVWIAHWDWNRSVYGQSSIADDLWNQHRRLHQYAGPHGARYGGVTINIDSDAIDGPVG